jgi:hypothetical protein
MQTCFMQALGISTFALPSSIIFICVYSPIVADCTRGGREGIPAFQIPVFFLRLFGMHINFGDAYRMAVRVWEVEGGWGGRGGGGC